MRREAVIHGALRFVGAALERCPPWVGRSLSGAHHGVISGIAGLIAYLPTYLLGVREGFWSAIAAVTVARAERRSTAALARDQFLGAAIGGTVAMGALLSFGDHLIVYAGAVVLAIACCWGVNVPAASRLAGVTTSITLLAPRFKSPEAMFALRFGEICWGVFVAVVTVTIATRWLRFSAQAGVREPVDESTAVSPVRPPSTGNEGLR